MEGEGKVGLNRDSLYMRQKCFRCTCAIHYDINNYGLIMSYTSGT